MNSIYRTDPQDHEVHKFFNYSNSIRARNIDELVRLNNTNIFKFMFVRHPFERLVSAYNSKLERPKTRKASKNERKILIMQIRKYQEKNMNMSSNDPCLATSSSQFPFSCFVDYVLEEAKNTHWWPYTELCRVCHVQYDLIGHVEDFHDDFQILQEKFSANKVLMEISKQKKKRNCKNNCTEDKKGAYLQYFHQLAKTTILRLYHKYKSDFELGRYDFPTQYLAAGIDNI